jgi:hypothetical protein
MADAKFYPDEWSEYCKKIKSQGDKIDSLWAQFAARYRAAQSFQSVFFMQLSEKVSDGYSSGMHLLLSYSAFELCCKASGVKPDKHTVGIFSGNEQKALKNIRRLYAPGSESYKLFNHELTNRYLFEAVDNFIKGESDNIQPVCAAVRHLIAHGHWTPTGSSTLTVAARTALEDMARSLLFASDEMLRNHVNSLKASGHSG